MSIGQAMTETIARADESVRAAELVAARDPLRPVFHFRPPAQWMNDICGALWHEGWYHIFYQFNPFADRCDWSCVNACWGHARSRDLVHWEQLPIAVAPSLEEGNYQCASGCATRRADGTPMLFYGHTPLLGRDGSRPPRQQWAALPLDSEFRTWRTLDIGLAPGQSGVPADIAGCWTDMFIFREAGRTFAIFKEANGLVVEARNPELTRWQAVGRIDGVFGECPNFIQLQDRWLLLRSSYPMTYQVGRFDPERIAFEMDGPAGIVDYSYGLNPPPDPADANYYLDASAVPVCRYGAPSPAHTDSRGFYATSVFADSAGRTLLLAWVGAWPTSRGWNCCMSLPRVLSLDAAGRLVQQPIPALAQLRGAPVVAGPLELGCSGGDSVDDSGDDSGSRGKRNRPPFSSTDLCRDHRQSSRQGSRQSYRIEGFTGDTLEVMVEFELGSAATVELALCDDAGTDAVRICYDGIALDANGTIVPRVLGDDLRRLRLHLFYDKSVMELFINDGLQTVTRVAIPPSPALHLEVAANDGMATVRDLTLWPIKPSEEY
jgi:sucrose-6-phosphate hydrolase SacC (GH32 family)